MRDNTNQKQYLPPFPIIDNPDSMDYPVFKRNESNPYDFSNLNPPIPINKTGVYTVTGATSRVNRIITWSERFCCSKRSHVIKKCAEKNK